MRSFLLALLLLAVGFARADARSQYAGATYRYYLYMKNLNHNITTTTAIR